MKRMILFWVVALISALPPGQAAEQSSAKRAARINGVTALQNTPIPSDFGVSANSVIPSITPPTPSSTTTLGQAGGSTNSGNGGTSQSGSNQGASGGSSAGGNGGASSSGQTKGQSGGSQGGGTGGNTPASAN